MFEFTIIFAEISTPGDVKDEKMLLYMRADFVSSLIIAN